MPLLVQNKERVCKYVTHREKQDGTHKLEKEGECEDIAY